MINKILLNNNLIEEEIRGEIKIFLETKKSEKYM